jgi:hypothetical protein
LIAEDERGDKLLGGAVDDPQQLAGARIVAGDAHRAGEHHLRATANVANERHAVAARVIRPLDAPQLLAVRFGKATM